MGIVADSGNYIPYAGSSLVLIVGVSIITGSTKLFEEESHHNSIAIAHWQTAIGIALASLGLLFLGYTIYSQIKQRHRVKDSKNIE